MNYTKKIELLTLCILLTGCGTTRQLTEAGNMLHQSTQRYVTGAKDAIDETPTELRTPEIKLAHRLLEDAEDTGGKPAPDERLNIPEILKNDSSLRAQEKEDSKNIRKYDAASEKLIEEGKLYEVEHHESLVRRIWKWLFATVGLGGIIALCIFCPAVLPLLVQFAGWVFAGVVRLIPSLVSFVGVVGKSTLDNVVKGVGNIRATLQTTATTNPTKTFTAQEVQNMLDKELAASTDAHDKTVIDSVRREFNV